MLVNLWEQLACDPGASGPQEVDAGACDPGAGCWCNAGALSSATGAWGIML